MTEARRLIGELKARDVSPQTIAETLGVSRSSIYAWGNGLSQPSRTTLGKIEDLVRGDPPGVREARIVAYEAAMTGRVLEEDDLADEHQ